MPARSGPGFDHEDLFQTYCISHGVVAAAGTYRSCMNLVAAHLNLRLGPAMLRGESDVQVIVPQISQTKFNKYHRSNFKSVLRKYVEMVRSNYEGKFDSITPVAIDVEANDLPMRGLAGEVLVDGLRFIDDKDGKLTVRSAKTELASTLFAALAERLGMLPDNQVRVLICVEGLNDARFLKHVSHTLHASDANLPDLSSDHRFVFIPMHGGNLRDVVNQHLFHNFRKPEFHIYDRDDGGTYAVQEAEVKARADGSTAVQTQKRYMESYIHPAAITRVKGVMVEVGDEEDYTTKFGGLLKVKKSEAKAILANEVAPAMTVEEIDAKDANKEIRGWLTKLSKMATQ